MASVANENGKLAKARAAVGDDYVPDDTEEYMSERQQQKSSSSSSSSSSPAAAQQQQQQPSRGCISCGVAKNLVTLLDLCVSSLRRGHANLLCIVPILSDDLRGESNSVGWWSYVAP